MKERKTEVTLTEMDLEIIWMCLVDSRNMIKEKQAKWEKSAAPEETKDKLRGCAFRQVARLDETLGTVTIAKRKLNDG